MRFKRTLRMGVALATALIVSGAAFGQESKAPADRAQGLLMEAQKALGGDRALQAIHSLSASGEYRQIVQENELNGEMKLDLLLPDRFMKTTTIKRPSGTSITRIETVNRDQVWIDTKGSAGGRGMEREGGMGRGRTGGSGPWGGGGPLGGGGPIGGGGPLGGGVPRGSGGRGSGGRGSDDGDMGRIAEMDTPEYKDMIRADFSRLLIGLLLSPHAGSAMQFTYDREETIDEGKTDVLKVTGPDNLLMDLYIDQKTHHPVMLSYKALMPHAFSSSRSRSRRDEDEDSDMRTGKQERNFQIYFSDYQAVSEKGVGDVWLPHRMTKSVEGRTQEEWTFKKLKINPDLSPKKFERKD